MHMIPAFIDESAPLGEIDVFRKLESSGHDWVVIHSLDLAPYNNYPVSYTHLTLPTTPYV